MSTCDVVIIGAGPYGLSAAAHLRSIKGLDVRVFGRPMSFWERNMPLRMILRSNWTATQIADPHNLLTLEAYQSASGDHFRAPVPVESFIGYGVWFQGQAIPDLDQRDILRAELNSGNFRVTLEDGEAIDTRRLIVAAGIGPFARRPAEFAQLPCALSSHASAHHDFQQFKGKQVLVIGSGQSALESAALLHETGAEVEVIGRSRHIHWLGGLASQTLHKKLGSSVNRFLYAPTDVGPAGLSQLMARPDLLKHLPRRIQDILWRRAVRPAGARWLVSRLTNVPVELGRSVTLAVPSGGRVKVRLDDGSERTVDHVLLGTGYKVDISKYNFIAPELMDSVARVNGYPQLTQGLESSVPRLHFLGSPAARTFGPLMQFVSGTRYASRELVRHINGHKNGKNSNGAHALPSGDMQ